MRSLSPRFPHARLALVGAALAIAGCDPAQPSTDVNQDRIYVRYELRQDRDGQKARASFRFGGPAGTQLTLDGGASVRFGDEPLGLVETIANLTYYERPLGADEDAGTFLYVDADGERFQNALSIPPPVDVEQGVEIATDRDTEISFTGPPVSEGEVVAVSLFRIGEDARLAGGEERRAGARTVTLPVAAIRDAAPGDITLAISRSRSRTPSEATAAGGEVIEVYEAPLRTARLVD